MSITAVFGSGGQFAINRVAIRASNGSGQTVHPVFAAKAGGEITAPWLVISGPAELGPGQAAQYLVQAPNYYAQQPGLGGFRMVALTTSPAAMSISSPYAPTVSKVTIDPVFVNTPVPPGRPITFTVRVVDHLGRPVLRAGTPVFLQQISYALAGQGPRPVARVIGAGAVGRVMRLTDSQGVARFVVVGTMSSLQPIYFRAFLLSDALHVPYGPSETVSVVFASAPRRYVTARCRGSRDGASDGRAGRGRRSAPGRRVARRPSRYRTASTMIRGRPRPGQRRGCPPAWPDTA